MAKKFPKTLYVKVEESSDADYFVADANPNWLVEMGEKVAVAKYQLVDVRSAEGVAQFGPTRK